jgi:hypothetical protein
MTTLAAPPLEQKLERSGKKNVAFLTPALETMVRLRKRRNSGNFLITAPHPGAGTSYVISLLATELTREFGHCVMISSASPGGSGTAYAEQSHNLWVPVSEDDFDLLPEHELSSVVVGMKREAFDFVLIDAPALSTGRRALRLGQGADGAFLVVEAGITKREQIEQAQRYFAASATRLHGVILNRRTYAIPDPIFKVL